MKFLVDDYCGPLAVHEVLEEEKVRILSNPLDELRRSIGQRAIHTANRIIFIDDKERMWLLKDRWDEGEIPRCLTVRFGS